MQTIKSDAAKSIMLGNLMGCAGLDYHHLYHPGNKPVHEWVFIPNLYDPVNMTLAWRVLNWAEIESGKDTQCDFHYGWMEFSQKALFKEQPKKAQRIWLDKILSLASEAGMVEVEP